MSSKPLDTKLYNSVKAEAKRRFRVWPSAYGSQWLVKTYKQRGGRYEGKKNLRVGVARWNQEKWRDELGNPCGSAKNKNIKKCRPTIRVSKDTPVTWKEMSSRDKAKAIREKRVTGMGHRTSSIRRSVNIL